jgi:hypothetical protein
MNQCNNEAVLMRFLVNDICPLFGVEIGILNKLNMCLVGFHP